MPNQYYTRPAFQLWYEQNHEADFIVLQMNWLQKLLYRCLLQTSFVCESAPYIPNNDDVLWILAGAENREMWQREKPLIMDKFEAFIDEQGHNLLRHKRLESDYLYVVQRREDLAKKRSEAGKKGAEVRWQNGKTMANGSYNDIDTDNDIKNESNSKSKLNNEQQTTAIATLENLNPTSSSATLFQSNTPLNTSSSTQPTNINIPALVASKIAAEQPKPELSSSDKKNAAIRLATYLHCHLLQRPEVTIPAYWLRKWTEDFESLLTIYPEFNLYKIIDVSQMPAWQKYVVRAKTIVDKADQMYAQVVKLESKNMLPSPLVCDDRPAALHTSDQQRLLALGQNCKSSCGFEMLPDDLSTLAEWNSLTSNEVADIVEWFIGVNERGETHTRVADDFAAGEKLMFSSAMEFRGFFPEIIDAYRAELRSKSDSEKP